MAENFVNIMVALDVDNSTSRDNINQYIKQLKNLDSIKVQLEVDGASSLSQSLGNSSKVIQDLQNDVKQLKKELSSLGGNSLSDSVKSLTSEFSKSYKSLEDLEKKVKSLGGSLKVVTGKGILPGGMESDTMVKMVEAQFKDIDGLMKKISFKPDLSYFGEIKELNQIKEVISNIDFKDFDKKSQKTQDLIDKLGRQGNLTAEQLKDLKKQLSDLSDGKSVSELEKLNAEIKKLGDSASQAKKFENAIENIGNQVSPVINKLQQLSKIDGIDKIGLNKILNDLQKMQNLKVEDILNDQHLKKVNLEFDRISTSVKDFIKEADKIKKVNNDIAKLEDTINKLSTKGLLSQEQASGFLDDTQLISKTSDAVKKLGDMINKVANETEATNKIKNTYESIIPAVDRLNDKLNITVSRLGNNIDLTRLDQLRDKIYALSNTEIKTTQDITRLNNELRQTEQAITQLSQTAQANRQFETVFERAERALVKLEDTGYASAQAMSRLRNELNSINTGDLDGVRRVLSDIDDELREVANNRGINNNIQQLTRDVQVLENQLERTMIQHQGTFNPASAQRLQQEIIGIRNALNSLPNDNIPTAEFDRLRNSIARTRVEMQDFGNETLRANNSLQGMAVSMGDAVQKMLLWGVASGAIYGTLQGFQDLIDKVVELDTALVSLARVSDAENFELEQFVENSISKVTELGGVLTDFTSLVEEFARSGNTLSESFDLAETATVLQNISDLDAKETMDALTAAMINFGREAEDSIEVADKLNEIDNKFSITTKDLALSLNKAASTASTFGVELDQLLGYTTAIGTATRE